MIDIVSITGLDPGCRALFRKWGKLDGSEVFVGDSVQEHRGVLKISYPMEHGVVRDWEDMVSIWSHVYSREVRHRAKRVPACTRENFFQHH